MPYPTSAEIYTKLTTLANDVRYRDFCTQTNVPNASHLGITGRYVKIAKGSGPGRTGFLITAGIHAREWAPPAAVLSLVVKLLDAYERGVAIVDHDFTVSSHDVALIVENLDIYVAPMINPDGYDFSRSNEGDPDLAMWRKNMAPAPAVIPPACTGLENRGVDINRNFDVVWNFNTFYSRPIPDASELTGFYEPVRTSDLPCTEIFFGDHAESEPETRNVKDLLDKGVNFYVDVHSVGPDILHSWGIENNQSVNESMNFRQASFNRHVDGTGGRDGKFAAYKEWIPADIDTEIKLIANRMKEAIHKATGADYLVQEGALLYGTSGAADDYAFSRHFVDVSKPQIFAYTVECGSDTENRFFPLFDTQFPKIEREVHAALLAALTYASSWKRGMCLIATAAYGSALQPEVLFLRAFRDRELKGTELGRLLTSLLERAYYSVSPAVARYLDRNERARALVRLLIVSPIIRLLRGTAAAVTPISSETMRRNLLAVLVFLICLAGVGFAISVFVFVARLFINLFS